MPIPYPFIIYGNITYKNGSNVISGSVKINDITTPQGSVSAIINSGGKYTCNIMDYATHDDNIQLQCVYNQEEGTTTFKLDISGAATNVDLSLIPQKSSIVGSNTMTTYGVGNMILGRIK